MRMPVAFLFWVCFFGFCNDIYAEETQARVLFYQGNAHYSEEKFAEAIADYERALSWGLESGPLYYNLGNAYFKQGSLGKAILNYLRAQRLMPEDADLKSNLAYAQSLIKGGVILAKRNWFTRVFFRLAGAFSLNGITLLVMILYLALAVLVILVIVSRRFKRIFAYGSVAVLAILLFSFSLFYAQYYQTLIQKKAVVVVETAASKFEPFDDATTFFTLYEGEVVEVVAARKGWVKVKRIDGRFGWIKESDIEAL